jgi:hypothetical protein
MVQYTVIYIYPKGVIRHLSTTIELRVILHPLRFQHGKELNTAHRARVGVAHPLLKAVTTEDVSAFLDRDSGFGDRFCSFVCCRSDVQRLKTDGTGGWLVVIGCSGADGVVACAGLTGGIDAGLAHSGGNGMMGYLKGLMRCFQADVPE